MKLKCFGLCHCGAKRLENQDNIFVNQKYIISPQEAPFTVKDKCNDGALAVFDGMGGEKYGADAAIIGASILDVFFPRLLQVSLAEQKGLVDEYLAEANEAICEMSKARGGGMGSTIALLCLKDNVAGFYNVGDSAGYLFRAGQLQKMTHDHTVEQQKIDMGVLSEDEKKRDSDRNRLTQHLGIPPDEMVISPHHSEVQLEDGDLLLLCSDGLTDMLSYNEIAEILQHCSDVKETVHELSKRALKNGGKDNISVIVAAAQ